MFKIDPPYLVLQKKRIHDAPVDGESSVRFNVLKNKSIVLRLLVSFAQYCITVLL